jgi:hypothetical protein
MPLDARLLPPRKHGHTGGVTSPAAAPTISHESDMADASGTAGAAEVAAGHIPSITVTADPCTLPQPAAASQLDGAGAVPPSNA